MAIIDKILAVTKQLYPTGRAFKMPEGGFFESLHKALAKSETKAYEDALSILNNIIPDNNSFSEEDATAWERRLGLITSPGVSLSDRKKAIERKINFPGSQPARQHYLFLEGQLQKAGFDVYVHENRFPDGGGGYVTSDPLTLTGGAGAYEFQHGDAQHGDFQHGKTFRNIVVNHIDEDFDATFDVGTGLRNTFFIGGATIGTFASVPTNRKDEFRQLILRVKPVHTCGYLFINYI